MARISATYNMKNPRTILITAIAIACHQANKAWCQVNGDDSQKDWNEAEDWQKESALKGVEFRLENPFAGHDAQHNSWMKEKTDDGWVYGEIKDAVAKTHPCIVPFDKLPEFQQKKDALFCAIVDTLSKKTTELTFEEADELRKIGECIALPEWEGFWFGNIKTGKLLVFTKEEEILDTPSQVFKLRNDWKVVTPTAEQLSRIKNYFEKLPKELTFGQKLVGLTFNPSGDDRVGNVKQLFADVLDAIGDPAADTERRSYSFNIIRTQAINTTMLAQMAVVKFLTWRE